MFDILPQRLAGSQGSADAAIARVERNRPLCFFRLTYSLIWWENIRRLIKCKAVSNVEIQSRRYFLLPGPILYSHNYKTIVDTYAVL